jgi:DNA-binding IclR family transcriptional regulator
MLDRSWIMDEGFKHLLRLAKESRLISRLALWDGNSAVPALSVNPFVDPIVVHEHEPVVPAYCSALGRTFLAFLDGAELDTYLEKSELIRYTDNTVVEKASLLRELELVSNMGYCIVEGEMTYGIARLAAPVFGSSGGVEAAVGISGSSEVMRGTRLKKLITAVLETAKEMSWSIILASRRDTIRKGGPPHA